MHALKCTGRLFVSHSQRVSLSQSPSSSEVCNADTNVAPHILAVEKEELVREQGTKTLLPDGNCDRMDMKVLGLANQSFPLII